jgi:hypothetical protein
MESKDEKRLETAIKKTRARTRKQKTDQIQFLGMKALRTEIQEELDSMSTPERVEALHEDRKVQVTRTLETLREKEQIKDGLSLYKEYEESIDSDFESANNDYYEAWWWSSKHIKELYRRKCETQFWKDLSNEQ